MLGCAGLCGMYLCGVALTCDSRAAIATRNTELADSIPSCAAMAIVEYGMRAVYQFKTQMSCYGDDKKSGQAQPTPLRNPSCAVTAKYSP